MGISRQELFSRLQLVRILEPLAEQALRKREDMDWRGKLGPDDPHDRPWHTSFHASSFPADNPLACPRKALYTLMDVPKDKPFSPKGRLMMEMGKTVEQIYVEGFYYMGILLSPPPWEETQLGFKDEETWLTGNCDAVILPPELERPHVWECKQKSAEALEKMRVGLQGPDERHVIQAKTYVCFMRPVIAQLFSDLPLLRDGSIFYVSRDDPRVTAEFLVTYDEKFMEAGREKLKQWKEWFENDILPTQELPEFQQAGKKPITRHPLGREFKWTELPCKFCDFGQTCREDHKAGITKLSESEGIRNALALRKKAYKYQQIREAVFAAWEDEA